jgi:hypothetical protein
MSGLSHQAWGHREKLIDSLELVSKPAFGTRTSFALLSLHVSTLLINVPRGVPTLSLDLEVPYIRSSVSPTSSLFLLSVTTFPINQTHNFAESHHGSSYSR